MADFPTGNLETTMRTQTFLALAALALAGAPAAADEAAATACAAGLPAPARAIYDAALPAARAGGDLKGAVTAAAKSLVMGGKLARSEARANAEAAGACLKKI